MHMEPDPQAVASVGVDRDLCITAAVCLAYGMYDLDDEAKAVLLTRNGQTSDDPGNPMATDGFVNLNDIQDPESGDALRLKVLESARACPFGAIIVRDAAGKQLWPVQV